MTTNDEQELHRLSDMLKNIDQQLEPSSPFREALAKAALALHQVFINGHRKEIENQYSAIGRPLSDTEREHLKSMDLATREDDN